MVGCPSLLNAKGWKTCVEGLQQVCICIRMRFLVGFLKLESVLTFEHLILSHGMHVTLVLYYFSTSTEHFVSVVVGRLFVVCTLFEMHHEVLGVRMFVSRPNAD